MSKKDNFQNQEKEKNNQTQKKQEEIQKLKSEIDQEFILELQALLDKYKKAFSITFVDRS